METKDDAKHPTMHSTNLTTKEFLAPDVHSEAEKPELYISGEVTGYWRFEVLGISKKTNGEEILEENLHNIILEDHFTEVWELFQTFIRSSSLSGMWKVTRECCSHQKAR